ncbi:hypothetical protein IQ226_04535 [Dolichospermum sp. LEGE 00240]|uniref:hypothetical protein n=1 Tax=Dolichospermum sp. LEGE 00240 TaxID=1828603 RepID=UPI0018814AC3|nr:hypothetical protein [Dolichospermum sp. LEGE 00240]MBE9248471.1 hypothetical protein [Dolichospermum sp. LEGE 00240]MDM3851949.1 hypothetical protein [Aphanizomenon gracile PMC627.10]
MIALPHIPKKRSHPPHSQNSELLAAALRYRTSHTSQNAIAHPHIAYSIITLPGSDRTPNIPKRDSYGALRYRTPTSPKSELLAAALRYRTPNILKKRSLLHSNFVLINILH